MRKGYEMAASSAARPGQQSPTSREVGLAAMIGWIGPHRDNGGMLQS